MDDDREDRSAAETGTEVATDSPKDEVPPERGHTPPNPVGRPRIEGVEAGVAAGLVPPPSAPDESSAARLPGLEEAVPQEILAGVELPDWTDPPTREIPRILLRGAEPTGPVIPGPVWRESELDFEQDEEAFSEIVSGSVAVVEHDAVTSDDDFDLVPAGPPLPGAEPIVSRETPAPSALGPGRPPPDLTTAVPVVTAPAGHVSFAGRAERPPREPPARRRHARTTKEGSPGRNPVVATVTGLGVGAIALACFAAGPAASLAITAVALLLATAEYFQALRRAHLQPAALLGLVAAPGFAVAAYEKGPVALPLVMAVAVVAVVVWYLVGVTRRSVLSNISTTLFGICWIALLGAFAALLLDPAAFPARHGVAYLLGAVEVAVAYDVGGYAIGSLLGRHPLAPRLSPRKTWEGLVGGSACAILVGLLITARMHPWTLERAAALALAAAVLAPLGDLVESMLKRDLHLKDMGRLLPAHGGVLDRVDAILFVLPATYFIVRLFHG